jgi:DNA-binding CsgD family transcriptional regulator
VRAFLEAAYQWDLDEEDWLRRLVLAAGRVWGSPPFSFGVLYQAAGPYGLTLLRAPWVEAAPALREPLTSALCRRVAGSPDLRDTGPTGYGRPAGLLDEELRGLLAAQAVPDLFFLHGREPTGSGCLIGLAAERTILAPDEAGLLRRLAQQLSSACSGRGRRRGAGQAAASDLAARGALGLLTRREQQVVLGAASGKSTKEIAHELGISPSTARVLLSRACSRLGVRSRKQLLTLPSVRALIELRPLFTAS